MKNFNNMTAHGVTYKAPTMPPANLFWVDPKGHENFWCSVQGDTSGTSSSPRTECRETNADDSESFNWLPTPGTKHTLRGTVRTELAPSSGKVIVAQIHAHGAPNPFLMFSWWNGFIRVDARATPESEARNIIKLPHILGKAVKFILQVERDAVRINIGGVTQTINLAADAWVKYPFYFKRGAYVIDHDGPAEEGGWVVYESCEVTHETP